MSARSADIWADLLALPIFFLAGWPVIGWVIGSGLWIGQRAAQGLFKKKIETAEEPKRIVALTAVSTMIRAWGLAFVVLAVGLRSERIGLAVALTIVGLFTVYFMATLFSRYTESETGTSA